MSVKTPRSYRLDVYTDSKYSDIPSSVEFSIDEATAQQILRLAQLVRRECLYKVERLDYRATYTGSSNDFDDDESASAAETETDELRVDAPSLNVSDTDFWFAANIHYTDVEIHCAPQSLKELAAHFELPFDEVASDLPSTGQVISPNPHPYLQSTNPSALAAAPTQSFPLFAQQFPEARAGWLPVIPSGWRDTSSRSDGSASFIAFTRADHACIRVWINFPTEAHRALGDTLFYASWISAEGNRLDEGSRLADTDGWPDLLSIIASEIARWTLRDLGYEPRHLGARFLGLTRFFASTEFIVTGREGALPTSWWEPINVVARDRDHVSEDRSHGFANIPEAREFLGRLDAFVRSGGSVAQFPWDAR